jgi:hypothetical protein
MLDVDAAAPSVVMMFVSVVPAAACSVIWTERAGSICPPAYCVRVKTVVQAGVAPRPGWTP